MTSTSRRNRSISTKVTDAEYNQIVARAAPSTVSEWAREILVKAIEPVDIEFLLLAELLALRTIVLNLNFALAEGGPPPTSEAMRRLIDRADGEKVNRAHRHVAEFSGAASTTSQSARDEDHG